MSSESHYRDAGHALRAQIVAHRRDIPRALRAAAGRPSSPRLEAVYQEVLDKLEELDELGEDLERFDLSALHRVAAGYETCRSVLEGLRDLSAAGPREDGTREARAKEMEGAEKVAPAPVPGADRRGQRARSGSGVPQQPRQRRPARRPPRAPTPLTAAEQQDVLAVLDRLDRRYECRNPKALPAAPEEGGSERPRQEVGAARVARQDERRRSEIARPSHAELLRTALRFDPNKDAVRAEHRHEDVEGQPITRRKGHRQNGAHLPSVADLAQRLATVTVPTGGSTRREGGEVFAHEEPSLLDDAVLRGVGARFAFDRQMMRVWRFFQSIIGQQTTALDKTIVTASVGALPWLSLRRQGPISGLFARELEIGDPSIDDLFLIRSASSAATVSEVLTPSVRQGLRVIAKFDVPTLIVGSGYATLSWRGGAPPIALESASRVLAALALVTLDAPA